MFWCCSLPFCADEGRSSADKTKSANAVLRNMVDGKYVAFTRAKYRWEEEIFDFLISVRSIFTHLISSLHTFFLLRSITLIVILSSTLGFLYVRFLTLKRKRNCNIQICLFSDSFYRMLVLVKNKPNEGRLFLFVVN